MTEQVSPTMLIARVVKLPNAIYALAPLLLLMALCQPIVQDRDLYFSFTHAYPAWLLAIILLPACFCYLLGLQARWSRIALACALILLFAMPFIEAFLDEERLRNITRLFGDDIQFLSNQHNYRYFHRFEDNWQDFIGLAWLTVPALLFCIVALIAPKYRPNQEGFPTLAEIKSAFSKQAFSKQAVAEFATSSLSGMQARAELAKTQLQQKVGDNEAVTNMAKDKMSQLSQAGKGLLNDAQPIKDNLKQQINQIGSADDIKQLVIKNKIWVGVAGIVVVILGSWLLSSSDSPSARDVEKQVVAIVDEIEWKIDIDNLDIEQCEQAHNGIDYRCLVTAEVELYDPNNNRKRLKSSINETPRTFKYRDGEWQITLDHILSTDAQFTLGMMVIGDMFEGLKRR
ncbi:hypothetical protein [Vibrio hippocampi]|nr:hypothetical protein [Vibrio hippocampi]